MALGPKFGIREDDVGPQRIALPARSSRALATFIRSGLDPEVLRTLATTAIEAAVHAGAEWADVRISDQRMYMSGPASGSLLLNCGFGIRVRVRGAEAFAGGTDPKPDVLIAAAKSAVATARGLASTASTADTQLLLVSVPAVKGEWHAPIDIDPFSVSVDDHAFIYKAVSGAYDGPLTRLSHFEGSLIDGGWFWSSETRVFASSEGSLLTQFLGGVDSRQSVSLMGQWRAQHGEQFELSVPFVKPCTGGFEVAVRLERYASPQATIDELVRYASFPSRIMEVGRQNVVLDGALHAGLIGTALLPALSLNRALGNDVDLAGTSLLSPPETVLHQRAFSPMMNVNVDAAAPHFGAAAWDDEGVARTAVSLIAGGTVANYLSSRSTLASLESALPAGHAPLVVPGVMHSEISSVPAEVPQAISMAPSAAPCSLTALAKQLGTGLLTRGGRVSVDPDGRGGYLSPTMLFEVRHGEIVARIRGARLMFSTKRFLPTLSAVGDVSTCETVLNYPSVAGVPWEFVKQAVTAPAGLYHNADVVSTFLES